MKHGDYVQIRPRPNERRKPLSGWIVALEKASQRPTIALDEASCHRLGAQSATVTCNTHRVEKIEA